MTLAGQTVLPPLGMSPITILVQFRIADGRAVPPFPAGSADLVGGGTAFLDMFPRFGSSEGFPDAWVLERARYEFADAAPVPEPATMWLLGAGVALAMRIRHGRRSHHSGGLREGDAIS
jgi:hypothetical protein